MEMEYYKLEKVAMMVKKSRKIGEIYFKEIQLMEMAVQVLVL